MTLSDLVRSALACLIVCRTASAQSAPAGDVHRVTVIGCVARSRPDVAATTGTTVLEQDQTRYLLVNVTLSADAQQSATADSRRTSARRCRSRASSSRPPGPARIASRHRGQPARLC